jgi:hypothetical protein
MTPYYQDESVTIYHGDCMAILPSLGSVTHTITDPPYARDVYIRLSESNAITRPNPSQDHSSPRLQRLTIPATGKEGRKIHDLKDGAIARMAAGDIGCIDEILHGVATQIARLTKRWAIVFSDAETTHRWRSSLTAFGMRYVRTGAWVKPDAMPQMSGDRPSVGFEPCTITHAQGRMRWNGGGKAAVWTFGTAKANRPDHPCPKPLGLMTQLVEQFTDLENVILDPFMGSGTTLVAAKHLGRRAIGIEIEERYCEIAARRCAEPIQEGLFQQVVIKPEPLEQEGLFSLV